MVRKLLNQPAVRWHAEMWEKEKCREPEVLFQHILRVIAFEKDLAGKKVLVTAGPTQEAIRSGALYHQSFYRENGLCHCRKCHAAWCGCDFGNRSVCRGAADVC